MLKQLLEPKDEVLNGRLQGVIDIERVADPKRRALESRPRDFLQSTFVSGEIRRLVESINKRLNSTEAETGLFLAEGPKGVGKSHGLLIPLHLSSSPAECQPWLSENGLTFNVPAGTRVIWRKFTDFPLESLWGVIGEELGVAFRPDQPPDINQFRAALGGKKLILIFDELETEYRNTLGFAMLITHSVFHEAIHGLVAHGTVIGLRHPADNACGRTPRLTADQLSDAVISEPL